VTKHPSFVFVHGAWHNSASWRYVISCLRDRGYAARSLDLPGAGVHAKFPLSYTERPLDVAAFAQESSPTASVTQAERTQAVLRLIQEMEGPVVLVGNGTGGLTISAVAEAIQFRLQATVYVSAFLLPPGISAFALLGHETMAASKVPALLLADPAVIEAARIDPRTEDSCYRACIRATFFGDLSDNQFGQALSHMHCDEPVSVMLTPSSVTQKQFGLVDRHYILCLEDRAIPLAAQEFMIAATDGVLNRQTCVHRLPCSHSAFLAQPRALAQILERVGSQSE
jgi:pimeloyl-ACP methyl ester carboxylesterase